MIKIGIINKTPDLAAAVRKLSEETSAGIEVYDLSGCCDEHKFDVMVINDFVPNREAAVSSLRKDGFLIVNADNKEIYRYLPDHQVVLITYGFSGKACVTASSVMENELQICIQRRLPTLSGQMLEEQEFVVFHKYDGENVCDMLSAATTVMAAGVEIEAIAAQPVS